MRRNRSASQFVVALEPRRLFAAGVNDSTFSGDGILTHSFGTAQDGIDSIVQSDGKIVVVGDTVPVAGGKKEPFIARYNADGTVDTSFGGGDGVTIVSGGGNTSDNFFTCVAQQSDGKLVAAGFQADDSTGLTGPFLICRFTTTGALDTSFAAVGNGITTIDFSGGADIATGIAVLGSGKIMVTGTTAGTSGVGVAMTRLESTGSIDTTFVGSGVPSGRVVDRPSLLSGTGYAAGRMVIDSSGRVVTAITKLTAGFDVMTGGITISGASMGVARYTTAGAVDTSFSTDGKAFVSFNRSVEFATGVALDPRTGKIVLGGTTANGTAAFGASLPMGVGSFKAATRANYAVTRFTVGGGFDNTFSGDGKLQVDFGATLLDGCSDIVVDATGRITASGGSQIRKSAADFSVCRITPGGGMDSGFDGDGMRIIDLGGSDGAFGMTIQTNGNTILVGHTKVNGTRGKVAVIRLLDD